MDDSKIIWILKQLKMPGREVDRGKRSTDMQINGVWVNDIVKVIEELVLEVKKSSDDYVGFCEQCSGLIMEGDEYMADNQGVLFHKNGRCNISLSSEFEHRSPEETMKPTKIRCNNCPNEFELTEEFNDNGNVAPFDTVISYSIGEVYEGVECPECNHSFNIKKVGQKEWVIV